QYNCDSFHIVLLRVLREIRDVCIASIAARRSAPPAPWDKTAAPASAAPLPALAALLSRPRRSLLVQFQLRRDKKCGSSAAAANASRVRPRSLALRQDAVPACACIPTTGSGHTAP